MSQNSLSSTDVIYVTQMPSVPNKSCLKLILDRRKLTLQFTTWTKNEITYSNWHSVGTWAGVKECHHPITPYAKMHKQLILSPFKTFTSIQMAKPLFCMCIWSRFDDCLTFLRVVIKSSPPSCPTAQPLTWLPGNTTYQESPLLSKSLLFLPASQLFTPG